jgi:hypothetical protein
MSNLKLEFNWFNFINWTLQLSSFNSSIFSIELFNFQVYHLTSSTFNYSAVQLRKSRPYRESPWVRVPRNRKLKTWKLKTLMQSIESVEFNFQIVSTTVKSALCERLEFDYMLLSKKKGVFGNYKGF